MTQSDLIVMIFDSRQDAPHARIALEMMRGNHQFGLEHAAEIMRDHSGRMLLHQRMEITQHAPHPRSHLPAALCCALFGHATEEHHRKLAEAGLDEFFVNSVSQALAPGRSALLIFVPHDNASIDKVALFNAVTLLDGALHRTSVPSEFESVLLSHMNKDQEK